MPFTSPAPRTGAATKLWPRPPAIPCPIPVSGKLVPLDAPSPAIAALPADEWEDVTDEEEWRQQWLSRTKRRRHPRLARSPVLPPPSDTSDSSDWKPPAPSDAELCSDLSTPSTTPAPVVVKKEKAEPRAGKKRKRRSKDGDGDAAAMVASSRLSPSSAPEPSLCLSPPPPSFGHLFDLPSDVSSWVLTFLHPVDLLHLSSVSRGCQRLTAEPSLWRPLVHDPWPISCEHPHDWRRVYVARIQRALKGAAFFCTQCDCARAYTTQPQLEKHTAKGCRGHHRRRIPDAVLPCTHPGCSRAFRYHYELKAHVASHSGQRKFPCTFDGCGKSYDTPYHLRLHSCRHTGEKRPHPCTHPGCERSFNSAAALRKHAETHGGNEEKRAKAKLKCGEDGCGRVYASSAALKSHVKRRHEGDAKRWKCSVAGCSRGFYYRSHLERHMGDKHSAVEE